LPRPDRRAVSGALAALFATAGSARAARPDNPLLPVIAPQSGAPMASAGLIARRADGSVALKAAAGQAFGPAGARPFDLDQPFRVASVSKMVAASAFLPLVQQGGLSLDADASDAVGFPLRHPAWPKAPITLRMLLSHTSGLRNGPSYPVPLGHALSEAFLPDGRHYDGGRWFGPADHRPGDWFAYADVNFALVAQILERRTGERFDLHMRKVLFEPLDLDIGYNWSGVSARKRGRAAAALRLVEGRWAPTLDGTVPPFPQVAVTRAADAPEATPETYHPGDNGFAFSPQGGLRLSLSDMDRLAQVFGASGRWKGKQMVPAGALELMQRQAWAFNPDQPNGESVDPSEPQSGGVFQGYGLGCETPQGRPGRDGDAFFGPGTSDWRGHLGDAYGWMTGLFWNRRDGRTLVWAVNGMPEGGRPTASASTLTAPEETLIGLALTAMA
jgi:CubicO group peptidase (beta-lactamase class C family)